MKGAGRDKLAPVGPEVGDAVAPSELTRQYALASDAIERGREGFAEAHRLLTDLQNGTTAARARGAINSRIWQCERAMGRRGQYFSQFGQDAFLEERVFRGKRNGVFVEVGAYDGLTGSNCAFFELFRGWDGILIEPSPTYHARAKPVRRAECLQVAVAGAAGEADFLEVREGLSQMSGLVAAYDRELRKTVETDPRHKGAVIRVRTTTLHDILESRDLERVDYVSLDIEGGELAVLRSFPFERFRIGAWTIENNSGDGAIPELMRSKGYRLVEVLGVDEVYVLPSL